MPARLFIHYRSLIFRYFADLKESKCVVENTLIRLFENSRPSVEFLIDYFFWTFNDFTTRDFFNGGFIGLVKQLRTAEALIETKIDKVSIP